jgi:hypothetical protein
MLLIFNLSLHQWGEGGRGRGAVSRQGRCLSLNPWRRQSFDPWMRCIMEAIPISVSAAAATSPLIACLGRHKDSQVMRGHSSSAAPPPSGELPYYSFLRVSPFLPSPLLRCSPLSRFSPSSPSRPPPSLPLPLSLFSLSSSILLPFLLSSHLSPSASSVLPVDQRLRVSPQPSLCCLRHSIPLRYWRSKGR